MNHKRRSFIKQGSSLLATGLLLPKAIPFSILKNAPNETIRIGVIGTGDRGQGLMKILMSIKNIDLVALCDTLDFRLNAAAVIAPKAKKYKNYKALLAHKDLDAVIISTPLNTHATIASAAIDAGLHIYCEKTMVKGDEETLKLYDKLQTHNNKIFQTGHQYHSSRLYAHLVEMIQSGEIGVVSAVHAQWNRNGNWRRPVPDPKFERQVNWRMYREYSYGLTAELSSHQIDFCNWFMDAHPEKVTGFGDISYWKDGRETYDNTHLIYSYPNGVKASFTCLTANAKDDYQIKVLGDKGSILIDYQNAWKYPEGKYEKVIGDVDGVSGATASWTAGKGIAIEYKHTEPTRQALEDFRTAIIENKMPLSNFKSGAKVAFAVDMGIRAMDTNQVVNWNSDYNL
ncbi:MAG: Gfo/Idh/MocA family protein [Flavobacteriaceae bacterium]